MSVMSIRVVWLISIEQVHKLGENCNNVRVHVRHSLEIHLAVGIPVLRGRQQ